MTRIIIISIYNRAYKALQYCYTIVVGNGDCQCGHLPTTAAAHAADFFERETTKMDTAGELSKWTYHLADPLGDNANQSEHAEPMN